MKEVAKIIPDREFREFLDKLAQEYLMLADLMEMRFRREEE